MTASALVEELLKRGFSLPPPDPSGLLLHGLQVLGGYGHSAAPGAGCSLAFTAAGIAAYAQGTEPLAASYADLLGIEIGGAGEIRSGGGVWGGGVGLEGAAVGIAAATVLNTLTTRSRIETIVNVRAPTWQMVLLYDRATPEQLRLQLAAPLARLEAARRARPPQVPATRDPAQQLNDLVQLKERGALSPEQFEAAKAKVLREM